MAKTKSKKENTLEVKVILTEEFLKENQDLSKIYKNGSLHYDLSKNIPNEVLTDMESLVKILTPADIVNFNPIVEAVNELQSFKDLKYDPKKEKESIQQYKDAKKYIGSFNTSLRDAKRDMKAPHKEVMDMIETMFKHFVSESNNSKNALETNYKPYLDEVEKKKEEAEKKKKAEELALIAKLQEQNKEILEKQQAQQKKSASLLANAKLDTLFRNFNTSFLSLNEEGLKLALADNKGLLFDKFFSPDELEHIEEDEIEKLKKRLAFTQSSIDNLLNEKIKTIQVIAENKELQHKNEVMAASIPDLSEPVEETVTIPGHLPAAPVPPTPQQSVQFANEVDEFESIASFFKANKESIRVFSSKLSERAFNDPTLEKTRTQLLESVLPKISDWFDKTDTWAMGRIEKAKNK